MISLLQPDMMLQGCYLIQRELGRVALARSIWRWIHAWATNPSRSRKILMARSVEPLGRKHLAMDYGAGDDLDSVVEKSGSLSVNQAVQWTIQVLNAPAYRASRVARNRD